MKQFIYLIFTLVLIVILSGCSNDNNVTNDTSGLGGLLGGGTGNVTFTVAAQQGQNGGTDFVFTPSTNITVTQVAVSLPAQNFQDNVQGDGTTVFGPQNAFSIGEYNGVGSGQQWTFRVTGNIGGATGTAYDVTTNFTIP